MFDLLSTGALVLDDAARLSRINAAAEVLLELSVRQAVGVSLRTLLPDAAECHAVVDRARAAGAPISEREMLLTLPSGRTTVVDCTVTPLIGPGEPGGCLIELVALDRALRISREEALVEQNEIARNVVRGLAHEIRNPLGGIRGAAQLLDRQLPAAALREYTGIIIGEADRLQRLLDRLLGPRARPEPRLISIHQVTERVAALLEAEAPAGVRIERDYDPSIPAFEADPEMLIQALLNVARNAVQAVASGGTVKLRTRIERHGTVGMRHHRLAVRVDVEDDGPGVPAELADRLFYPMVSGRSDGTGLGLSIAQSLVNQHGGIIELRGSGPGALFSLLLPFEGAA